MNLVPVFDTASFARGVRAEAEGSGWAMRQGTLSRISRGNAFHVYEFAGSLRFLAKPVLWDQIFWQIMHISFKRKPSPSRHFWGMNCKTPAISEHFLKGHKEYECAKEVLPFAESALFELPEVPLTLQMLRDRAQSHYRASDYVTAEVVELHANGQHSAAQAVCDAVLAGDRRCSFSYNTVRDGQSISFFELARDWTATLP